MILTQLWIFLEHTQTIYYKEVYFLHIGQDTNTNIGTLTKYFFNIFIFLS